MQQTKFEKTYHVIRQLPRVRYIGSNGLLDVIVRFWNGGRGQDALEI